MTNARIVAATLLLLLACLSVRELIPARGGVGYDGIIYTGWVKHLSLEALFDRDARPRGVRVSTYSVHRVLEPVLFHYLLDAAGVEATGKNVIATFTAANLILLLLAVWWLCASADRLGLGDGAKWLAFVALMLNYVNAKMPFFYPVLTDSAAVALGSGMLLLHLSGRTWALAAVTLAGGFVWPSLPYFGVLMIAFPVHDGAAPDSPAPARLGRVAAGAAALGSVAIVAALFGAGYAIKATPVEPLTLFVPLSSALVAGYLYFGLRPLLDSQRLFAELHPLRLVRNRNAWLALATLAVGGAIVQAIPRSAADMNGLVAITDTFYTSVTQPGVAWVAHALHYGPIVLLLLFLWPRIVENVRKQGTGLVLCFALAVLLGAGSESRKLLNFYPVIVLFLAQAAAPVFSTRGRWIALVVGTFVFSKLWLPMSESLTLPIVGELPWRELYVSSRGPWIDAGWWAAQGAVVVAVGAVLYVWSARPKISSTG